MNTKEAGQTVVKFGAGAAGLTVGKLGMTQVSKVLPASFPAIAKKVAPGIAGMLLAYLISAKVTNDKLKAMAMGLGLAGFADLAVKLLGDKVPFIKDNVPALSGAPYAAVNTGGVGYDYYRDNSLQGLGDPFALSGISMQGMGNPYALNGDNVASMQGTSMQGGGGAMSAAGAYALN